MSKLLAILIISVQLVAAGAIAAEKASPKKIAFSTEFEGDLMLLDCASGKTHQLKVGGLTVGDLAYSSARHMLAFDDGENHAHCGHLYLLHLKNLKVECIYRPAHDKPLYRPQFDPQGTYLYAIDYYRGIYRYSFSSRTWKKMRISGLPFLNPQGLSFSKSGRMVVISPGDFKGFYLARVENGEFAVQKKVAADFLYCISPQWFGDKGIVFAGRKVNGLQYIWKLDLTSGRLVQITKPPLGAGDFLSLSKDEKTIVFNGSGAKDNEWELWEVSIDGAGLKQLAHTQDADHPVWIQ